MKLSTLYAQPQEDRPAPKPVTTMPRAECLTCVAGSCSDCAPNRGAHPIQLSPLSIERVMAYQFEPLIHRMIDKHGWEEGYAREVFEDLKRYMWLAIETGKPIVPSPVIDEIWHDFILFTMDYAEFCQNILGTFLHHRPRRRDDKIGRVEISPVVATLRLARKEFGRLSRHWNFPGANVQGQGMCNGNACDPVCN